jgi:hypothetical protein
VISIPLRGRHWYAGITVNDLLPGLALVSTFTGLVDATRDELQAVLAGKTISGFGQLYCPRCQRYSRVSAFAFSDHAVMHARWQRAPPPEDVAAALLPSAWVFSCLQCQAGFYAMVFVGSRGPEVVLFSTVAGGLTTPHTTPAVAYYLDQAARADSAGAKSAAVVMFRSALEHVLHESGYTEGMCGAKLAALAKDVEGGKGPPWTKNLTVDDLSVLNRLGNAAVHPNGGDIGVQSTFDEGLLIAVSVTFSALLDAVYQRPKAEERRRQKLTAALTQTKPKKPGQP